MYFRLLSFLSFLFLSLSLFLWFRFGPKEIYPNQVLSDSAPGQTIVFHNLFFMLNFYLTF